MKNLAERICEILNGFEGRKCDFLPESLGMNGPAAGVFFQSGVKERRYLDGSVRLRIPFAARMRIHGICGRERLDVFSCFMSLAEYLRGYTFGMEIDGGRIDGIFSKGVPTRVLVSADGCEEYVMKFEADVLWYSPFWVKKNEEEEG